MQAATVTIGPTAPTISACLRFIPIRGGDDEAGPKPYVLGERSLCHTTRTDIDEGHDEGLEHRRTDSGHRLRSRPGLRSRIDAAQDCRDSLHHAATESPQEVHKESFGKPTKRQRRENPKPQHRLSLPGIEVSSDRKHDEQHRADELSYFHQAGHVIQPAMRNFRRDSGD